MSGPAILSVYRNLTCGGMGTVYRNRALASAARHDLVFLFDAGGIGAFCDLGNVGVDIVPADRMKDFLARITRERTYDQVRLTNMAEFVPAIDKEACDALVYEIHFSNESTAASDLAQLNIGRIDQLWVPSRYLADSVATLLPPADRGKLRLVPNWSDVSTFRPDAPAMPDPANDRSIPLVWVGRLGQSEKNGEDFLRLLAMLPSGYRGIMAASYDTTPGPMAETLSSALRYGVEDRLEIFVNLPPRQMAALYRRAALDRGVYVSTALIEAFGLSVLEAMLCGMPVVAYAIEALGEHADHGFILDFVDMGDLDGMAEAVLRLRHGGWDRPAMKNVASSVRYREVVFPELAGAPDRRMGRSRSAG